MSKETLRAILLASRNALTAEVRYTLSNLICSHLIEQLPNTSISIGSYLAHGSEVILESFHHQVLGSDHQLFVPKIQSRTEMEMVRLASKTDLIEGKFKIQTSQRDQTKSFDSLNWLVMPCVGFDHRGNRLGMGGGFYDRALAHGTQNSPLKIGVGFNCQKAKFEPEPWDVPFDWIVTETGVIRR